MRPSLHKKIKTDDSSQKLKENVYLSMYPSPCQSYDPNKWLQSNDVSWLSASLDQDIDKMLKIALPQPLIYNNRRSSSNRIIEEADPKLQQNNKKTWNIQNKENNKQLENSKLKINMSQIICEFPIQKVSRNSLQDRPETPNNQKSFMEAIISRYHNTNQEKSIEKERNFIFQDQQKLVKMFPQSQDKEKNKQQNYANNNIEEIQDNNDDQQEQQDILENQQNEKIKQKSKHQKRRSKKTYQKKQSRGRKTKGKQQRVSKEEIKIASPILIQEKTKVVKTPQNLDKAIFNTNQSWGRLKIRKEAKKQEYYQVEEFKDLLQSLQNFYIHKSEGDLKIDKIRPMQNIKGRYFQQFELWINPYVLIGPVKMQKDVKLHIRFKKGYSGQVYCDKKLEETLPNNQVDGKTFINQDLILANSSDHVVKLVCCLVNIKLSSKKKSK